MPDAASSAAFDRYAYVNNNPINFNDPSGQKACSEMDNNGNCVVDSDWVGRKLVSSASIETKAISNIVPNVKNPETITEKAFEGDINAIIKLITPTHLGIRGEGFVCYIFGCLGGGGNVVHNFVDNNSVVSTDFLGGISASPSFMPKLGVFVSIGPLIGWGSSNIEQETSGISGQFSVAAAAEEGIELSLSAPIEQQNGKYVPFVDPVYGQVPFTLYPGFGIGLALGGSLSVDYTAWRQQIGGIR